MPGRRGHEGIAYGAARRHASAPRVVSYGCAEDRPAARRLEQGCGRAQAGEVQIHVHATEGVHVAEAHGVGAHDAVRVGIVEG
eukprot:scaffold43418_cov60-Phaeocystis_antarctica.AAC.4